MHIGNALSHPISLRKIETSLNKQEIEQYLIPIVKVLQTGIEQKIIRKVNFDILAAFMYHPITVLANPGLCQDFELNEENIDTAFTLARDAIKL